MGCAECTYVALYSSVSTTFNIYLGLLHKTEAIIIKIISLITEITMIM